MTHFLNASQSQVEVNIFRNQPSHIPQNSLLTCSKASEGIFLSILSLFERLQISHCPAPGRANFPRSSTLVVTFQTNYGCLPSITCVLLLDQVDRDPLLRFPGHLRHTVVAGQVWQTGVYARALPGDYQPHTFRVLDHSPPLPSSPPQEKLLLEERAGKREFTDRPTSEPLHFINTAWLEWGGHLEERTMRSLQYKLLGPLPPARYGHY